MPKTRSRGARRGHTSKHPALLPEKPQVCHQVSAALCGFLDSRRHGKIVLRKLRHSLASRSATGVIHGRSPVSNAAPGAFAAECWNNLRGSNRICTAVVTFLETFGRITGNSQRSLCTETETLRLGRNE